MGYFDIKILGYFGVKADFGFQINSIWYEKNIYNFGHFHGCFRQFICPADELQQWLSAKLAGGEPGGEGYVAVFFDWKAPDLVGYGGVAAAVGGQRF